MRVYGDAAVSYHQTLATRFIHAGVSPVFVAQIIGHSGSTNILSTYARAIDEYRRDAIHKLENLRSDHVSREGVRPKLPEGSVQQQPLQFYDNLAF